MKNRFPCSDEQMQLNTTKYNLNIKNKNTMKKALATIEELQKHTNLDYVSIIVKDKEEIRQFAKQENLAFYEPTETNPHYWTSMILEEFIVCLKTENLKVKTTITFED